MPDKRSRTNVALGEFPFPLTDGPEESRYLTWIRNHSNYMAVRGLVDYVRAVAVLVRGVIVNALVFLPYLIGIAVVVVAFDLLTEDRRFLLTKILLGFAAAYVVLFPLLTPVFKLLRFHKSLESGSDSSVKLRDRYERSFGALLLLVAAVAFFETMPFFVTAFHNIAYDSSLTWRQTLPTLGVALAALSASDKLLSMLGGFARTLAIVMIGLLGIMLPFVAVLYISDYIRETGSNWVEWNDYTLMAFGWTFALLLYFILAILLIGFRMKVFARGDLKKLPSLFVALAAPLALIVIMQGRLESRRYYYLPTGLDKAADSLILQHAGEFAELRASIVQSEVWERHRGEWDTRYASWSEQRDTSLDARYSGQFQYYYFYMPEVRESRENRERLRVRSTLQLVTNRFQTADSSHQGLTALESLRAWVGEKPFDDFENNLPLDSLAPVWNDLRRLNERIAKTGVATFHSLDVSQVAEAVMHIESHALDSLYIFERQYPVLSEVLGFEDLREAVNDLVWHLRDVRRGFARLASFAPKGMYPDFAASQAAREILHNVVWLRAMFFLALGVLVWVFCWLTVDVNLTSVHGLYRDRLASAFLVGQDTEGDVDIEEDLDLAEICRHEAGSRAPYHLINAALNLQGSKDIGIRDRKSDYFIFSKRFIGGERTGYCRSESMERVFPEMGLSTAMAISAAAASPNMGRSTNPALVLMMALLNVRLGFWVPNPGLLEEKLAREPWRRKRKEGKSLGYAFSLVFRQELIEVRRRWERLDGSGRALSSNTDAPAVAHNLVGLAFSGGGIRSATLNLGIVQALDKHGVFAHVDYMSTVSGGGYLGSSISALMRRRTKTTSEIRGTVTVQKDKGDRQVVIVEPAEPRFLARLARTLRNKIFRRESSSEVSQVAEEQQSRKYVYEEFADLAVQSGDVVESGQRLINTRALSNEAKSSFADRFRWRVRPGAFLQEMFGRLDEKRHWVNVSDGGHIENLAAIELLRRRCRYMIIGDGEADPKHFFNGLATLIRLARIDLGIEIEIDLTALRLGTNNLCERHWAIGKIRYPDEAAHGYLLYLKSSVTGKEDEVVNEYRNRHPTFPHESTADQSFTEGQFEAYRALGQHIGEQPLKHATGKTEKANDKKLQSETSRESTQMTFGALEQWFAKLYEIAD